MATSTADYSQGALPSDHRHFELNAMSDIVDEAVRTRKEKELLKAPDPFNIVEMAVELQVERMRTAEAMNARDAVVQRLVEAYESVRQKTAIIERMQQASRGSSPFLLGSPSPAEKAEIVRMRDEIAKLERTIVDLRDEIRFMKENGANILKSPDPPPCYEEESLKNLEHVRRLQSQSPQISLRSTQSPNLSQSSSQSPLLRNLPENNNTDECSDYRFRNAPTSDEPADMVKTRNAILATLPLPAEVPDDMLSPLSIPTPFTLQEFISNLSGSLRTSLAHYRFFYALTTQWCPEREEHGYFYAPAFKCSTNPRVATAHRWSAVDVISRMVKPSECFFNKDGIWYYAGVYKAFRLEDLTIKEWAELPTETTQAIVKDTISGRKNTSPQNIYEITQLYSAGALKVACVGLQCVGFNNTMYKALLDQATAFAQSKWKASPVPSVPTPAPAPAPIGTPPMTVLGTGAAWNASAGEIVERLGSMGLGSTGRASAGAVGDRNENVPVQAIGDGRGKR